MIRGAALGGIIATEDRGAFRTTERKEVKLIKYTSLGPVLLIGGFKPLGTWLRARVLPGWISARGQLQPAVKIMEDKTGRQGFRPSN